MNELKKQYWENGYLLLKDFLSKEESTNIVNWANELEKYPEEPGKWMIYFESNHKKSRIENILNYHEKLNEFVESKIYPLVKDIYGKEMTIFKDKLNWKMGHSKGFMPHQDQPAWSEFPADRYISVALFANESTVDNGCLEFVSKQHKNGVYTHENSQITPKIVDSFDWNYVTSTTSDVLLFDSYAPHRSGPNITNNSRRIFYFTFNEKSIGSFYNDYMKKKRANFPPNIERLAGKEYKSSIYNLANPII